VSSPAVASPPELRRGSSPLLPLAILAASLSPALALAATNAPVAGEIQLLTLDSPGDHWSGGKIVIGGETIVIPRNLLLDLPANRLTLNQLFDQAPAACRATGESGLARGDRCNVTGTAGFASIAANRTSGGNVIAGDVLVEKGLEAVTGTVSYIDYADGYFRLNGNPNDPTTGTMVRLNDPGARHTVQQGLGCAGGPNCSADPRFTLDPDNYVNVFSSGYPFCIPSTVARPFEDVLGLGVSVAQAGPDGAGDVLCPLTNRTVNGGQPVDDSRRFAPLQIGDSLTAEGNFETVNGVRFLSAHSTMVSRALTTKPEPGQPDYFFLDEVEVDAPGFQNQRARTLIIGYSTLAPSDVLIWAIHYDPATNDRHELPLATVQGCDIAAGPGTCGQQGLVGTGNAIFKIRHDVDFLVGAKPRLNPCAHLLADPRFPAGVCNGNAAETNLSGMFGILSPIMHEIQGRTGHALANPGMVAVDVSGNEATHGQYLFPFGMNLGGISVPEFNEINLDALGTPFQFSGIPWNLDRRLSPAGCIDTDGDGDVDCEPTPQPLDPFPYEELDPRTQASLPLGAYSDPVFTASPLSRVANRILSYVDPAAGNFNGDASLLAWPPVNPAALPILPTPDVALVCAAAPGPNSVPVPVADSATVVTGVPIAIAVLANDADPDGDALSVAAVSTPASGSASTNGVTVTYISSPGFVGTETFQIIVADGRGGAASSDVTVTVTPVPEALAVGVAAFLASTSTWHVSGTSTFAGATITVHDGPTLDGPVIGTAVVGASGGWAFIEAASPTAPGGSGSISVESSGGATRSPVPLTVR
jgi:hypothetical protein